LTTEVEPVSDTVLVAYASRFGSTRGIAERIGGVLTGVGLAVEVRAADEMNDVAMYRAFIVGSSVEGGHWLKGASAFLERHAAALGSHPLWLFSSGPLGDRSVNAPQPDPKEVAAARLSLRPRDCRVFAGAFVRATSDFSEMGLVERTVVRKFLPDGDWRDWTSIEAWAAGIARELAGAPVA
jgi:menaquinone-dependent protoporphyrinogen oxidase